MSCKPVKSETFTLDSNLPYVLGFVAYRLPGTESPDYAAVQILSDVLASPAGRSVCDGAGGQGAGGGVRGGGDVSEGERGVWRGGDAGG